MALPLSPTSPATDPGIGTVPDEVLRARLRRAARDRMGTVSGPLHASAGQTCLDVMRELKRRGVPLWRDGGATCACACAPGREATWDDAVPGLAAPVVYAPVLATG